MEIKQCIIKVKGRIPDYLIIHPTLCYVQKQIFIQK